MAVEGYFNEDSGDGDEVNYPVTDPLINRWVEKIKTSLLPLSRRLDVSRLTRYQKSLQENIPYIPDEETIKRWNSSEWIEYQAWIYHKEFMTRHQWLRLREKALLFSEPPLISVVTPVYNTDPGMLDECIRSVLAQAYPHWEMRIVDDGSTREETKEMLRRYGAMDRRIKVHFALENQGICHATNQALVAAKGRYVAFLDHDDRLSLDALFCVGEAICNDQTLDVVYSDRDMLSLRGLRFMHLFKPDWSPELLFSMNYICHLMVYRTALVEKVGRIHPEFEGSQDYDLILRAMEHNPKVLHIPKVLYHWRQNEQSVALNHDAKTYAYQAGVRALEHALDRRGLEGSVRELSDIWRGHYRVRLKRGVASDCDVVRLPWRDADTYMVSLKKAIMGNDIKDRPFVLILSEAFGEIEPDMVEEMLSWFQIPDVGMVTGKIVTMDSRIVHAGMVQKPDGLPLFIFEGKSEALPGYMAATFVVRNVSAPHPYCFAMRRSLMEDLGGIDRSYRGGHGVVDLALRVEQEGFRTVYTPFARFAGDDSFSITPWSDSDIPQFIEKWGDHIVRGDRYYNGHLTLKLNDMGLSADIDDLLGQLY